MDTNKNVRPSTPIAQDTTVDLLVVGSGTGMLAALAGHEAGLDVLITESTDYIGGSTALSGGGFWIPANSVLKESGVYDSKELGLEYLDALVGDTAPRERRVAYIENGPEVVELMKRVTPLRFQWAKDYADYQPEKPGGSATGRSCEAKPVDLNDILGKWRPVLRKSSLEAPVPMPITIRDYRWMNLMAKEPAKAFPAVVKRVGQGVGCMAFGREYVALGEALAGGLFAGVIRAGIPFWLNAPLTRLITDDSGAVTGAVVTQDGVDATVTVRKGVIISSGGFDHNMQWRHEYQSDKLEDWSHGNPGNVGSAIQVAIDAGADVDLLDQAWWFPSIAPLPGQAPTSMLAERSLPGSMIVGGDGKRFINEAIDYMSFGNEWLRREREGDPIGDMWIVFDQEFKNSYVFGTVSFPRMPLPKEWYEAGIAVDAGSPSELARKMGVPVDNFTEQLLHFNNMARTGYDRDFNRGASRYDNYYGDVKVTPNPNLRALAGKLYAVRIVPGDLGTCGGLKADEKARVLNKDGQVIEGLYATGNSAANAFGHYYPGPGATIGQGLVFGAIAARDAAQR